MNFSKKLSGLIALSAMTFTFSGSVNAAAGCSSLLTVIGGYSGFSSAVDTAYEQTKDIGLTFGMWATLMDSRGKVCAVYSVDGDVATANGGSSAGDYAWLGSRVISAQKANTANAFSLEEFSIPTGAVTAAVYEGGSLYGLQFSNPVDAGTAYDGNLTLVGTESDPLVGEKPGGVNVFGGGIALYTSGGSKVGAVGVSGDTSCRDAAMAFRVRAELGLDNSPNDDTLYLDTNVSTLFEQPLCTTGGAGDPNDPFLGVVQGSVD